MATIRDELVFAAGQRAFALIDYSIHNNIDKRYEFAKQTILADKSITKDEKSEAIKYLNQGYDHSKILFNQGKKRNCENCQEECLATLYCELCIRNYLKAKFSNWTSGNNNIDDLIQKCQMESLTPKRIVEWIPYNNLQNIKYLTKGGCAEIYTTDWIGGQYYEWDSKEQQLKRYGTWEVILKKLENVESANRSWFDEAKSHLTINNKWPNIVQCFGLTQDPSDGNYMLIMIKLDKNLRKYLQQNHNQLTWKERIKITVDIILALAKIHGENAIHRDLHSGNILYLQYNNFWYISDLGFCGPADKPLGSIYGNLPYIAPEVIAGKECTFASDIYSVSMLMWEISSGQPPFDNHENNYDLAMKFVNGMRPKIISGTPLEYKELMEQCWDADPTKRPNIVTLIDKINKINRSYHMPNKSNTNKNIIKKFFRKFKLFQSSKQKINNIEENKTIDSETNYLSSKLFTSNIYQFDNLPEPKNATEEEQETFHSKQYDFSVPDDIDSVNNTSTTSQSYINLSKASSILKDDSKELSKINSKNIVYTQDSYKGEKAQQVIQYNINDKEEFYDNPNLHSEEQDELEIPDDGF